MIVILFVAAFVITGVSGWRTLKLEYYLRDEPGGILRSFRADATTDGYITELLSTEGVPRDTVRRPSASIRAALKSLPPEGAVIFVVPSDVPKYNVMYLTWKRLSLPRPAYYLPCDNPAVAAIPSNEKIVGIVSYLVEPPAGFNGSPGLRPLMPRLALTQTLEADGWKPFCSQ
ncbi:MAG: hypothetical protein ABI882_18615 [Acidobacteriota bacterium]